MTSFDGYDEPETVEDAAGRHMRRDVESDLRDLIEMVANAKQMPLSNSALISRDEVLGLLGTAFKDVPEDRSRLAHYLQISSKKRQNEAWSALIAAHSTLA